MTRHLFAAVGCLVFTASFAAASTYGPSYIEPGDAGSSRDDAADVKNPTGSGTVSSISGSLSGNGGLLTQDGDFQDVFRIFVKDPFQFKIELSQMGTNVPDSMMFLFREDGRPVMASDNSGTDNFNPILDNNGGQFFDDVGIYYLAITSAPSQAQVEVDETLILLFNLTEFPFGTIAPAQNAEQFQWTDQWTTADPANSGVYFMFVDGVESLPVPGPASLALLGLAGLAGGRRRRR